MNVVRYKPSVGKDLYNSFIKRAISSSAVLQAEKTILYDFHVKAEGKMVDFAGYLMPVQYGKIGISPSHKNVRSNCGIFDVSHMLQTKILGKDRVKFMESLIVGDIGGLQMNTGTLSLLTNESGGIIDDLICNKVSNLDGNHLFVVSNAGCLEKDLNHMKSKLSEFKSKGGDANLEVLDDRALIAFQGPKAASILQMLTPVDLSKLYFMNLIETTISGIPAIISRCGYTGEDGFEISMPSEKAVTICESILDKSGGVAQLAGLGARDSLRLEAGLCLYGNDIDDRTTPIEARLAWTIGKRRREDKLFPGAEIILNQLKSKPSRYRVGLVSQGPPPRAHCEILDKDGDKIGEVTSGCPSPTLGCNIAMGYVSAKSSKVGTELSIKVRNKNIPATVSKMPFVKCNYYNTIKM